MRQAEALAGLQADRDEAKRQHDRTLAELAEVEQRRPLVEKLARSLAARTEQNHFIETLNMHLKGTR